MTQSWLSPLALGLCKLLLAIDYISTETKSMPDFPQEVEEVDAKEEHIRAEAGDAEQPTEGMAVWVLWVMHQNEEEGQGALEQWTHRGSPKPSERQ